MREAARARSSVAARPPPTSSRWRSSCWSARSRPRRRRSWPGGAASGPTAHATAPITRSWRRVRRQQLQDYRRARRRPIAAPNGPTSTRSSGSRSHTELVRPAPNARGRVLRQAVIKREGPQPGRRDVGHDTFVRLALRLDRRASMAVRWPSCSTSAASAMTRPDAGALQEARGAGRRWHRAVHSRGGQQGIRDRCRPPTSSWRTGRPSAGAGTSARHRCRRRGPIPRTAG